MPPQKRILPDPLRLTDHDLSRLAQEVDLEFRRRICHAAESGVKHYAGDALAVLKGQEMGKRALAVAAAGRHSLLIWGPSGCGKSTLRWAAYKLNLVETYEALCCPCGNLTDPHRTCRCSITQIERHRAKWPITEITIELCPVPEHVLASTAQGTTLADVRKYLAQRTSYLSLTLSEPCADILRHAVTELGITAKQRAVILRVARTIANLDPSEFIRESHLSEAINYRNRRV